MTVLVVAALDVCLAAAVAAVLLLLFVCRIFPHSIVTVTALESGRSPHGGGQRYVAVFLLRIRLLPFPASHPLAKLAIFFCHSLTGTSQGQSLPSGRTAGVSFIFSFS